jgi:ketosteroid isomerase-like protein
MTETFTEVAQTIQAAWAAGFARADWAAIAALYAPETAFYGSTPTLHTNPAGVRSYFESLPAIFVAARYAPPHILPMATGMFAASGNVVFVVRVDGHAQERTYRMSQVFTHTPDGWRIALHHASPEPA